MNKFSKILLVLTLLAAKTYATVLEYKAAEELREKLQADQKRQHDELVETLQTIARSVDPYRITRR